MSACGCKFYGNQHGTYYRFCETHYPMFDGVAQMLGESLQDMFNRIIVEYLESKEEKV